MRMANAPDFIGSFGVMVHHLGPWFGGLEWRILGPYPISDGNGHPKDDGYGEVNLDAGYRVNSRIKLQVSLYNLATSMRARPRPITPRACQGSRRAK